jgi:hypothetical protein
MKAKLVIGIATPLVLASAPAMAFGLLGLIGSVAGLAVGTAGGAALSSSGVGPGGQPAAQAMAPRSDPRPNGLSANETTGSVRQYKTNAPKQARRRLAPTTAPRRTD